MTNISGMNKVIAIGMLLLALLAGQAGADVLVAAQSPDSGRNPAQTEFSPAKAKSPRKQTAQTIRPVAAPPPQADVTLSAPTCLDEKLLDYCLTRNATSNPFLLRAPSFDEPDYDKFLPEDMRVKFHVEIEKRIDPLTNRELPAPKFKFNLSDPKDTLRALSGSMEIRILDF